MEENEYKVVKVTNISSFAFNGENGARYNGKDFLLEPGESLTLPFYVGEHLAKHLANAIIINEEPKINKLTGKPIESALWSDAKITELMGKIMSDSYSEEKQTPKTANEKMMDKITDLNKTLKDSTVTEDDVINGKDATTYKDKAEIIKELQAKDIPFEAKSSKAELEKLLA